jgi:hypothetical protein
MSLTSGFATSGIVLFSITPERQLVFRQMVNLPVTGPITITPDGRFAVIAYYEYPQGNPVATLAVFRIRLDVPALEEVSRCPLVPKVSCMHFLPQALPPAAADDGWTLYSATGLQQLGKPGTGTNGTALSVTAPRRASCWR